MEFKAAWINSIIIAKAKYIAASEARNQALPIRRLLEELNTKQENPTIILCTTTKSGIRNSQETFMDR